MHTKLLKLQHIKSHKELTKLQLLVKAAQGLAAAQGDVVAASHKAKVLLVKKQLLRLNKQEVEEDAAELAENIVELIRENIVELAVENVEAA